MHSEAAVLRERFEAIRKRLVDVSLRNRFLNYRPTKRKSIQIVSPDPREILDILVTQNKSVRFAERPEPRLVEDSDFRQSRQTQSSAVFITSESQDSLQGKLLQIWRDAVSFQEEQGVNLLFIALGCLSWYESENAQEPRLAPLLFIPVLLEREQGNKFAVRYEGTEIMANLSLAEMLRQQFNISIEVFESAVEREESFDLQDYFDKVKRAVADQKRWEVLEDFAVMAFFNFTKYVMYRDLASDKWVGDRSPTRHEVIQRLIGDKSQDSDTFINEDTNIDAMRPVKEALEVFDADSSQIMAIMQAKNATLMIVEGPPGTGKSQTITNLIAEAVYEGRRVLFVAEKRAALEVVWRRLKDAGIATACLELHSSKASKKSFYEQLNNTLRQELKKYEAKWEELQRLSQLRDKLNKYCHALHSPVPERGITPYRCIAELCRLGKVEKPLLGSFRIMKDWDMQSFQRKRDIVEQLERFVRSNGTPSQFFLWGCGLKSILLEDYERIREQATVAIKNIDYVLDYAQRLEIVSAEDLRQRIRHHNEFWQASVVEIEHTLRQYQGKWFRWLIPKYLLSWRRTSQLWGETLQEDALLRVVQAAKAVLEADQSLDNLLIELLQFQDRGAHLRDASYEEQKRWLNKLWETSHEDFLTIARFNTLYEEARKENLHEYAEWAATRTEAATELVNVMERTWYRGVLTEAYDQQPILRDFADEHEELIRQFRDLDQMLLQINRLRVAVKHLEQLSRHRGAGNLARLQRELQKSRRHTPIRQMMAEAGEAVLAITPVFMMSPLSVAIYLPPEAPLFDLVIFDEASQIKPEDALGAILRAKRAIIVGDSKQLPPTTFFDRLAEEDEQDDQDIASGMDSILDLAGAAIPEGHPLRKRLRWHYRSKHHSLIACSNRLFYRDQLVVAPNPEIKSQQLGIVFHYLPEAIYDRGGSRRNDTEARKVADAVIQHVKNNPHLSLGVAAFSIQQQQAIQDALEELRRGNPEYDRLLTEFDKHHEHEPLFVKNLETVQGDERDVIFISIGYGRDKNGYLSMNFGPLNKEGGERRLNVLITRARVRCEVFSSIRHSDLRVEEASSAGISALRTFLHYAETREMDVPPLTNKEPMSPFEKAVIHFLEEQGYRVEPQVGTAGFYIDIGVVDPNDPDRFVLGIECDGAQYHSSKTARDRDRLRQQVLEQRGWRIHRVWSTSWYRNPDAEKRRLLEAVQASLRTCSTEPSVPATASEIGNTQPMEQVSPSETASPSPENMAEPLRLQPYQFASPQKPTSPWSVQALFEQAHWKLGRDGISARDIAEIVTEIAAVESPVHKEVVIWRIRNTLGAGRVGKRLRETIEQGIRFAADAGKIELDGNFVWALPRRPAVPRSRAQHPPQYKKIEYIHPLEIKEAIIFAIRHHYGLQEEEVCSVVSKLLGFEKVTEGTRQCIVECSSELISEGRIAYKLDRFYLQ